MRSRLSEFVPGVFLLLNFAVFYLPAGKQACPTFIFTLKKDGKAIQYPHGTI
jgi:hypothetical protein